MMGKLLVTGANGFVGQHFCRYLNTQGIPFRASLRKGRQMNVDTQDVVYTDDISSTSDWSDALQGVSHVVHLASLGDTPSVSTEQHFTVNYGGTRRLAQQACEQGVTRFVFLSTIKVNGEMTQGTPFKASDTPAPLSDYARSKHQAEQMLLELGAKTDMEISIIRPPVIYGPGSRGSIAQLAKAIRYGLPLPFASLKNARSILSVFNLCSFMHTCLQHKAAANTVQLIADGEDVSTPQLVRYLGSALDRRAHLFACSPQMIETALRIMNRSSWYTKLCCDLQVDTSQHRKVLDWLPQTPVKKALALSFS